MVQAALVKVLEPIFEVEFAEHSYGFRPGDNLIWRNAFFASQGLFNLVAAHTEVCQSFLR